MMLAGCWWRERRTMRLDAMPRVVQVGSCLGTRYPGLIMPWSPTLEESRTLRSQRLKSRQEELPRPGPSCVLRATKRSRKSVGHWESAWCPEGSAGQQSRNPLLCQHSECAPRQVALLFQGLRWPLHT